MTENSAFFGARRGIGTLEHLSKRLAGASGLSETPSSGKMRMKSAAIWGIQDQGIGRRMCMGRRKWVIAGHA
jgi:hypothetical protein